MKDRTMFRMIGASNHSLEEREVNDFYATEPKATKLLCELEKFNHRILEGSCGKGHIAEILKDSGYEVTATDLIDRGYGEVKDFFTYDKFDGDIIMNPPYKNSIEFVKHSLDILKKGNKVAMFLKLTFLESSSRKKFFEENPPKIVYVSSSRLNCAKNGDFGTYKSSAIAYAWFIWEKGYKGDPIIKWFN